MFDLGRIAGVLFVINKNKKCIDASDFQSPIFGYIIRTLIMNAAIDFSKRWLTSSGLCIIIA